MTPKQLRQLLDGIRITDGRGFRLRDRDPADTGGNIVEHADQPALLAEAVARLSELQEPLYAEHSWALLCAFQAMDAAGKDGTIKHVMSGVNPQGVRVTSFETPGPEALEALGLTTPKLSPEEKTRIAKARHTLEAED